MKRKTTRLKSRTGMINTLGMWMSFCFLILLGWGFGGLGYAAVMDDWFLYLGTSTYSNMWTEYIVPNDKLSIRPLAGLLDCYVVAPLSDHIGIVHFCMLILLLCALWMLYRMFRDGRIQMSGVFLLCACLCPVGFEAIYWLSAATRIIPALFFAVLAVRMAVGFLNKSKKMTYFMLFFVFGLCAMGFYEAAIPVYIVLAAVIIIPHIKDSDVKPLIISLGVQLLIIALYYVVHSANNEIATRGQMASLPLIIEHFPKIVSGLWDIYTKYFPELMSKALSGGWKLMTDSWPYLIPVTIMSVAFGFFAGRNHARESNRLIYTFFIGIAVFIAGISVYFVLDNIRLPLRVAYIPLLGLAISAEALLGLVLWGKSGRAVYGSICGILSFVFVIAAAGEIENYRKVSRTDIEVARNIFEEGIVEDLLDENHYLWLFNTPEYYFDDNLCYYEHIRSASETESAITNCLMYYTGEYKINTIQPVKDSGMARMYVPGEHETFYYSGLEEDLSVSRLTLVRDTTADAETYDLKRDDYSVFGTLVYDADTEKYLFTKA